MAFRSPMDSSEPSRFLSKRRAALTSRVQRWARVRQGEDALPLTLQSRRIYILPTKAGVAAAVLLFLMLLAGMNYSNSLALLLCFTLCGVTLVSMHECHRTLSGLTLLRAEAADAFSERLGDLLLYFENTDSRLRSALRVHCAPCEPTEFHLSPRELKPIRAAFQAGKRGRQRIDRLELFTTAPLGLFRAWTWLHLPLEAIVYPNPKGSRMLPPRRGEPRAGRQSGQNNGDEEWAWLRAFQDSDPPRCVAWKAYARGAPLMVAHYDSPAGLQRTLDFGLLPGMSVEQRLSQLTRWVLECERLGESYALLLPQRSVPAGHGVAQRRACLESLGLHGL
jgi:uncharacterized protein (DUF58 family)